MDEKDQAQKFQVTDRRFWIQDETAIDKAEVPVQRYPSYVEELKARTDAAEQKLREKIEKLDKDNEDFRLRLRKDFERRLEQEKLGVLQSFLDVVDNFQRALMAAETTDNPAALKEGVQLNLDLLLANLKSFGIEPIDVQGRPFDPHEAEAVGIVPVSSPEQDQQVMEVVQQGYRCGDQLLRPARVRVGQLDAKNAPQEA